MPSVWSLVDFPELTEHIPFDDDLVLSRAAKLADVHGLKKRVLDLYLGGKEPFEDSPHVERQIYSGFAPRRDENIMAAFHKLEWKDRWALVQSISDQRYRELGERLIFSNAPESVPKERLGYWQNYMKTRLMSGEPDCEWLTLPKAYKAVTDMIEKLSPDENEFLKAHKQLYEKRLSGLSGRAL